jgi:tetrahydromethanopterin S-methyltransferase subunit H
MWRYDKEQKICDINGIKIGGQPGVNPPLLVANMFQKGDTLLESRKEAKFNHNAAETRIKELEKISQVTGIPAMVAMVANRAEEMQVYVDFFTSVTDMPFAIDIWVQKTRLKSARYLAEKGLQDRVLYNSITPWDEDIPSQVAELRELGIKHVVLQVFDTEDKGSTGRLKSLDSLMPMLEKGAFASILVDTALMNLPTMSLSLKANHLIKQKYGFPCGFAPSNGSYMWRKAASEDQRSSFPALDAGAHAVCAVLSDFLFYGPMSGTQRVFYAVATTSAMLATLYYEETGILPDGNNPLNLMFPDVMEQFRKEEGEGN